MKRVILIFIMMFYFSVSNAGNATVFPNPSSSEVTIKFKEHKAVNNVSIYNYLGVKVSDVEFTFGMETVANVSDLKVGKYFVNIDYADGTREVLQMIKK